MNKPTDTAVKDAWPSLRAGVALIFLVTIMAYLPILRGGFIWDDDVLLIENHLVKASDGLYRYWFTTEAAEYYPLAGSLRWVEWRLFGMAPLGYHVVNVLLHAANAILVWLVLRRLKILGAWLAALVFAIHPVNVATVAWISEQKNTLSMLFYAVAILLYLKFGEEGRWRCYGLSLVAFVLALLSKTAVVMLPVVLLGCVWWTRGRVRAKDLFQTAPFFVLSLVFGLVTIWIHDTHGLKALAIQPESFAFRLAAAGRALWFYLSKALLPADLMAVYPKWTIDTSSWVSYVPGALVIASLMAFWWKRGTWGRPLLFGLGYFVVMLFPVLGFFYQSFYRYSWVADHWQYYSIVGVIGLGVAAAMAIYRRLDRQQQSWGAVAGLAILVALGSSTWTRAGVYASEKTLWQDAVSKNPQAWVAHYNLGTWFLQAGRFDEAIVELRETARLRPDLVKVHSNLGIALAQDDKIPEAIEQFEQALQIDPNLFEVHSNLGHALILLGKVPEAMSHWEQALRIQPDSAEVHYDLGMSLERMGQREDAVEHYKQALKFNPDLTDAQNALMRLRAKQGRIDGAITQVLRFGSVW